MGTKAVVVFLGSRKLVLGVSVQFGASDVVVNENKVEHS